MRSDLPVTKLAENVYLLNEFDGTNCYLVVGSEKALLIDCGTGSNPINLIVLLLLSHIIYIGIRCYVKDWMEERGYY